MPYKPTIKRSKYGANRNCVTITTGKTFVYGAKPKAPWDYFQGRRITFKVCAIGNGIQIARGGRRGGARSYPSRIDPGGMVVCTARGQDSKCLRARDFVAFPGGGAQFKHRGQAHMLLSGFSGYSKKHRRTRRQRRGAKRRR